MKAFIPLLAALALATFSQPLQAEPTEPPVGGELRRDLLNAIRVHSEHDLGAPVEFVVSLLLADGDRAVAQLEAQRPGGGEIDLSQTPLHLRDEVDLGLIDGARVEAFLHRADGQWHVVEHVVGATDMWFWGYDCANYGAFFTPEMC